VHGSILHAQSTRTLAVSQWLFDPVYLNCRPVPVRLTVDIEFTDQ
jgi:hypothetical protein